MKPEELLKLLVPVVEKLSTEIAAVYLFGSAVTEDTGPLSDIDLAVLLKEKAAGIPDLRFRLYADFSKALRRNDIDVVVLNTLSNLVLKDEIVRSGLLFFDFDPEFREEFEIRTIHSCIDFKQQRLKAVGF
jgi:predicted nucleotidyltransferase